MNLKFAALKSMIQSFICKPLRWKPCPFFAVILISVFCLQSNSEHALRASDSITQAKDRPNVVVVLTDDQGYGDLGCHGNPVIKTPNIDKLFEESISLSDYHVAPTCSPTRSALLTGHWTNRTGVWHTINGRSMLRANEVTIGQLFKDAGYQTGMFGKWHLGDNYPYRPEDRGFTKVFRHGGGGVGQTPDVWDNSYFDGAYFHDGKIEEAKGFCTDVFFGEANQFIEGCVAKNESFLAYITLNAPHGPLHCPPKYLDMYKDQKANIAAFFGMISNIDDNVGKTRALLRKLGVYKNTIFIFTTDNGTATGNSIFNAEMRGKKGSEYDGGHRVPFMVHWPAAGWNKKYIDPTLTHAVDVVPTLLDMCGIKKPDSLRFDGMSVKSVLDPNVHVQPVDRMLVTDSQRVRDPIKWRKSAVMGKTWRLVNGVELYDISNDPSQKNDLAKKHPDRVTKMRKFYDDWWAELEPTFAETTEIYVGHPKAKKVTLTAHDWIHNGGTPWNQGHIRQAGDYASWKRRANQKNSQRKKQGKKPVAPTKLKHTGEWFVKVIEQGTYKISVRRWPEESGQPINSSLPAGANVPGASKAFRTNPGTVINAKNAVLRIDGNDVESKPISANDAAIQFTAKLSKGTHRLSPYFSTDRGELGAFYVIVESE